MKELGVYGKQIYVYGLGGSSISALKLLKSGGAELFCWDDNSARLDQVFRDNLATPRKPEEVDFKRLHMVLKAPGVAMTTPFIAEAYVKGVPIVGDLDLFWRKVKKGGARMIGITGTNGKSTTTALVGHVLKAAGRSVEVGGNIGINACDLPVLGAESFYVLEVSSYQLETLHELHFNAAAITNLTPDHLDRHGSMDMYLATKMVIFRQQTADDTKVICTDTPMLESVVDERTVTVNTSGAHAAIRVDANGFLLDNGQKLLDLTTLNNLPGRHNWQNIAVAWALLKPYLAFAAFAEGVQTFKALPHRLEQVGKVGNVLFVNDSKATNPESAICALESFRNIFWLAGGKPKAEGIKPCLHHLQNVRTAFLFGQAEADFAAELQPLVERHMCGVMKRAVFAAYRAATTLAPEQAVVLLSPACASFDQFNSFEHRGQVFAEIVHELAETEGLKIEKP